MNIKKWKMFTGRALDVPVRGCFPKEGVSSMLCYRVVFELAT